MGGCDYFLINIIFVNLVKPIYLFFIFVFEK